MSGLIGKKALLTLLLAVLAGVAVYDMGLFSQPLGEGGAKEPGSERAPQLRLDLLDKEVKPYNGVKRDIFTIQKPTPRVVVMPKVPESAPVVVEPVAPPPAPPPSELQVFISQAHYIGLLDRQGGRTVFINSGKDVITVKKGDVIGARFMVEEINDSELILKDSATGEDARIFLRSTR